MTRGKLWTREDLLLALNLYYKIPFGQFDQRNQKVIELAKLIDRTPSSIAMQLSNFASLDPYHQNRGVSGLRPPGKLAQQLWIEAQNDWDNTILESEKILDTLPQPHPVFETVEKTTTKKVYKPPTEKPDGPTETERAVKIRLGQRFFRASIMANYRERCCVCGIPIPELLIASHIIPWKDREDLRLNPSNGLCLCALHDKAFDRGLLSVDDNYKVMISLSIHHYLPQEAIENGLITYNTRQIFLPDRFAPEKKFLEIHRQEYFVN
ncbi:MAG: HNH endonuclease [Deltaproteobacteria bacterium]|nr:HNH endonuclease [Deltaproteobacteria bacterium]